MEPSMDETAGAPLERRKRPDLRRLFDEVVGRVAPFFQESGKLDGSRADFWVVRAIGEAYPQLNNEEAHLLARAAIRFYSEHK